MGVVPKKYRLRIRIEVVTEEGCVQQIWLSSIQLPHYCNTMQQKDAQPTPAGNGLDVKLWQQQSTEVIRWRSLQ